MNVEVTRHVVTALMAEAARCHPQECCGLLLGRGRRIETALATANVASDPRRRFEIDPVALLAAHRAAREGGPQILGYYHSHPGGLPEPSAVDREHSTGDLRIWAITGEGRVAFWRDSGNGFSAIICDIIDGNCPDSPIDSAQAVPGDSARAAPVAEI